MIVAGSGDPSAGEVTAALLASRPQSANGSVWASNVLAAAQLLPGEQESELLRVATAVREWSGSTPRHQAWAEMLVASQTGTRKQIVDSCAALITEGDPATATLGLNPLMIRARRSGERFTSELLLMAHLAVIDNADAAQPFTPHHDYPGQEAHEAITRAWSLVCALDLPGLADHLEAVLPSTGKDEWLAWAIRLTITALRSEPRVCENAEWLRGRALRTFYFAIPTDGYLRFPGYWPYVARRNVGPGWAALAAERWAESLMVRGRFREALDLLEEHRLALGTGWDQPVAFTRILGAQGRAWRFGGDPHRALDYSNRALHLIEPFPAAGLNSNALAGYWINRSYALEAIGDKEGAYDAATKSRSQYKRVRTLKVGRVEARALQISTDTDRVRALDRARALLDGDPLPSPVEADTLRRIALCLAEAHDAYAFTVFERAFAATRPDAATRIRAVIAIEAARLWVKEPAGGPARVSAIEWARRAVDTTDLLHSPLLKARARLLHAHLLIAPRPGEAVQLAHTALDELTLASAELTASGVENIVNSVRQDLVALLELAIDRQDGRLALRIFESGRSVRLAAMLALRLEDLPPSIRQALAEVTLARRNEVPLHGSLHDYTAAHSTTEIEDVCGKTLSGILLGAPLEARHIRETFPLVHLVATSAREDMLLWMWWPPGRDDPLCGREKLSRRAVGLIEGYGNGTASQIPGDTAQPLIELLPGPLITRIREEADGPVSVMLCPAGSLWNIPYPAIPIGDQRLSDVADLNLTPSLRWAAQVAATSKAQQQPRAGVQAYFNPVLSGASLERVACGQAWGDFAELDGVTSFGTTEPSEISIISTHATPDVGFSQQLLDHKDETLSAAQCLTRTFSPTVFLGTCHGFSARAQAGDEPIGLLTVINARGARWVVGGHQRLYDPTIGWILSQTYKHLANGCNLFKALRLAQAAYLQACRKPGRYPDLDTILAAMPGEGDNPWYWALTISGLPAEP